MKREVETVTVDRELAKKIEVLHPDTEKGGFQRTLRKERLGEMVEKLSDGVFCPPIVLAKIGQRLVLVDGQHRFEAWKQGDFQLQAVVFKAESVDDAAANFVELNGHSVRVALAHRLIVDPRKEAQQIRKLAEKFKVPPVFAWQVLIGVVGYWKHWRGLRSIDEKQFRLAEDVLKEWSNDPRWESEQGIYAKPGTVRVAASFATSSKDPIKTLRRLKKLNYTNQSGLASRYGFSNAAFRRMKDYVYRKLSEQGI